MGVEDLAKFITTKGDLATGTLGFVAGYVLDLVFVPAGVPPIAGGSLGAATAIGFKSAIQALWEHRKKKADQKKVVEELHTGLESNVAQIEDLVAQEPFKTRLAGATTQFRSDHDLWKKKLISDDEFRKVIADFITKYRNVQEFQTPGGRPSGRRPLTSEDV